MDKPHFLQKESQAFGREHRTHQQEGPSAEPEGEAQTESWRRGEENGGEWGQGEIAGVSLRFPRHQLVRMFQCPGQILPDTWMRCFNLKSQDKVGNCAQSSSLRLTVEI